MIRGGADGTHPNLRDQLGWWPRSIRSHVAPPAGEARIATVNVSWLATHYVAVESLANAAHESIQVNR